MLLFATRFHQVKFLCIFIANIADYYSELDSASYMHIGTSV